MKSSEMSPNPGAKECDEIIERWLASDEDSLPDVDRHLGHCEKCSALRTAMTSDRNALREYFRSLPVPPPPTLEFRGPLQSASGHPRRVSLAVLPFLWALLLVGLLVIALLLAWWVRAARASAETVPDELGPSAARAVEDAVEEEMPPGGSHAPAALPTRSSSPQAPRSNPPR